MARGRIIATGLGIVGMSLTLVLSGCESEQDLKRAPVEITQAQGAEFFWFAREPSRFVVVWTPQGIEADGDMLTALAWPDRLVLALPAQGAPPSCAAIMQEATTAATSFTRQHRMPPPEAPVIVGLSGAGAAAVDYALSSTPAQSHGAVALDYCPSAVLASSTYCHAETPPDARSAVSLVAIPSRPRCDMPDLAPTLARFEDARAVPPIDGQTIDLMSTVVSQMLGTLPSQKTTGALDLPLIELPARGNDDRLAIVLSGDGGWANIDKQLGQELSARGIATVGFDMLKYYWRRKTPEEAARDLARVITHYSTAWQRQQVMLIGYSFGADIMPFLWNNLDEATRAKVGKITLIGLADTAAFEITVGGWVGVEPGESYPTLPEIAKIKGPRLTCIYGEEEDSACPQLREGGAEVIALPGGHHFDGQYKKVADAVLAKK